MFLDIHNPQDRIMIAQYGKAYGTVLLQKWLPEICRTRNLYVFDGADVDEFNYKKMEENLPEIFSVRADAKTGEPATLGVEGAFIAKNQLPGYIERVKKSNPNGVVLCIDTEDWTHEKINTDGAFNVYFNLGDRVTIDYLGRGFDMGAITKGKEHHEVWDFQWEEIPFIKPNATMNRNRIYLIDDEKYLESARRRIEYLLRIGYSEEQVKGKIPRHYSPMPPSIKEKLLDEILFPLYSKQLSLRQDRLTSFGVQGMIIGGKLFPIEMNRMIRCAERSFFNQSSGDER